jgi:hypothetical protein
VKKLITDPALSYKLSLQARSTASKNFAEASIQMSMNYYRQFGKQQNE